MSTRKANPSFKFCFVMLTFLTGCLTLSFPVFFMNVPYAHALEESNVTILTPAESFEFIKQNTNLFILDVRDREISKKAHFGNSVNIPAAELHAYLHEVPKDRPILIHCYVEQNGKTAAQLLDTVLPDNVEVAVIRGALPFD